MALAASQMLEVLKIWKFECTSSREMLEGLHLDVEGQHSDRTVRHESTCPASVPNHSPSQVLQAAYLSTASKETYTERQARTG
jgi:hypothetical protein